MKKKAIKIFTLFVVVAEIFFPSLNFAKAAFHLPSASQVASELENRYHVNLSSMQETGENFNVSVNKTSAPEVSLSFNPSEPKEGQEITANATPIYFSNPGDKLYYGWYLSRKDCDLTDEPSATKKENCDNDSDGKITVNDWKVEAMRLIAQGGYNYLDEPVADYTEKSNDDDGYEASIGGDDKSSVADSKKHCYIHDFQRGINAEIKNGCDHLFPSTNGNGSVGDDSFDKKEENFWKTDPQDPNTSGNGNFDEANVSGLGQDKFKWVYQPGDRVGVVVEGTSIIGTKYDDSSSMVMWALPNNECTKDNSGLKSRSSICSGGKTAVCAKSGDANYIATMDIETSASESTSSSSSSSSSSDSELGLGAGSGSASGSASGEATGEASGGGSHDTGWCAYVEETPDCTSGTPYCSVGSPFCVNLSSIYNNAISASQSCEGLSLGTPTCQETTDHEDGIVQTETKSLDVKGYPVSIPTTDIDINDCLDDNLVDPAEKTNEKLDVSLSATPENPINDSSGDQMGDMLSVNSIVTNSSQNYSQLHYDWKISAGKNISGSFQNISNELDRDKLLEGKLTGINNPNINIRLNLGDAYASYFQNEEIGYLKIELTVKQADQGKNRTGKSEVIVKVNSTDKRIKAYLTTSSDGETLDKKDLICNGVASATTYEKLSSYICPVVKNQILRLEVNNDEMSDFSWMVNGTSFSCDKDLVKGAECDNGNVIFLPIIGNEGDTLDVKVGAKRITVNEKDPGNGKSLELTKSFQIVKPYVKIISGDENVFWPKALGSYNNLDGEMFTDFSDSEFETYSGVDALLDVKFHPDWLEKTGIISANWTLDGEDKTDASNPKEIKFSVLKDVGESYNAEFYSFYAPSNEIRKVLKNYWGIAQEESGGKTLATSITAEVINGDDFLETTVLKNSGKFLASIISNLPGQTIFLIRMALIVFVMILISGLAMNLSPNFYKNRK
ncbi:MAG: hypothetical protein WC906_04340 [Parcubacteria group bacterium]|jgi:hypothetical protein